MLLETLQSSKDRNVKDKKEKKEGREGGRERGREEGRGGREGGRGGGRRLAVTYVGMLYNVGLLWVKVMNGIIDMLHTPYTHHSLIITHLFLWHGLPSPIR